MFIFTINLAAVLQNNFNKYINKLTRKIYPREEIIALLLLYYKDKISLFNLIKTNCLLLLRSKIDYIIKLINNKPSYFYIYSLS